MAKLKTGRHTGSIKQLRKSKRQQKFNRNVKYNIHEVVKALKKNIQGKNQEEIKKNLSAAISKLDKAAKHNIIHPNAANRKKSQLMKLALTQPK